jgi:hypothetical protein
MNLLLEQEELLTLIHNCFCDGGLELLYYSGIQHNYKGAEFTEARELLQSLNPTEQICYEDVLVQILRSGNCIMFLDNEDDLNEVGRLHTTLTKIRLLKAMEDSPTLYSIVVRMLSEDGDYDGGDCDSLLQCMLFGTVIYG